ncbi:methyltransferase domain-containing protein [bacterium]|nr:methyltransferase domain-containing protein [bacterium]MBU1984112.1 methyltransferase domain-containing protein [bacterium]
MSRKPDEQTLPKGAFRNTHEWQRAQVPKLFRAYWERLAAKNGYYNHKFMADWADGLERELVLDAGCGDNTTLGKRKEPLKKLVGLDPLQDDLKKNPWPRHRTSGVIEHLPFADEVFAGVYCDSVFEHIDDPKKVCREFFRVMKPGGRVLINTNSVFNPFMFPNKFLSIRQREWIKEKLRIESEGTYPAPYRINTRRRLVKHLRSAGFVNIRIYRWGVPPMYRPKWVLVLLLLMELIAETPLFCGLKHRLMATCEKPQ